jgi:capsular polysaccharide biosynthesis protein
LVVSQQNEILIQSLSQRNATQVKYLFGEGRKYPLSVSEGRHVALLCFAHYNYFHWLLDAALRLMLLDPDDASFKVIVPATTARFIRQILELLGISEDRVVAVSDQSRLRVDELVFAYPSRTPAKPNSAHFMELRRRLFAGAGIDPTTKIPHRRLYISRANSARRILNEDELLPILRHHGFEIIFSEEYTIAEQIALFAEASVIAGAHGAGFTNVLFARPGTTVIEIFNRRIWFDCYAKMSSLLGQEHWHMFAENEDDETFSTRVDARKFEKLLDYALR